MDERHGLDGAPAEGPTSEELAAYGAPEPGPELVDRVMAALEREGLVPGRASRRRRWPWIAAAVACAAGLAAVASWWASSGRGVERGEVRATAARRVDLGERAEARAEAGAALSYEIRPGGLVSVDQTAGAVHYEVRPGGPFEVRTPAGLVAVRGTEFRVEVSDMRGARVGSAVAAAAAAALVTVAVYEGRVLFSNDEGQVALAAGDEAVAETGRAPRLRLGPAGEAASAPATKARTARPRRLESEAARAALLRAIETALSERAAGGGGGDARPAAAGGAPAAPPAEEEPRGTLDRGYIQDTIRDAVPLIRECYEMALGEDATLSGRVVVHFTIVGDESVGGLVERAEVEPAEGIDRSPSLDECLAETVMSLAFPPPEGGGRVEVSYPFVFSNGDDGDDAPPTEQ